VTPTKRRRILKRGFFMACRAAAMKITGVHACVGSQRLRAVDPILPLAGFPV
jgi:hypothetical protein